MILKATSFDGVVFCFNFFEFTVFINKLGI